MLFNSIEFLIFLPIVFLLYWKAFRTREQRNILLLVASYFFYGWWSPKFLLLIFVTSLASYFSGIYIYKNLEKGNRRNAKLISAGNIVLNLGILGVYKYFDFFSRSFADAMSSIGWEVDAVTLNLILPVGISFYTFQALSYTIDIYKEKLQPTKDVVAFFVFIGFFPQLIAGPIERATNLLPQFLKPSRFDYAEAVSGMRLILWGLFKKMLVADNASTMVEIVFRDYSGVGTLNLWIGAFLFSMQIYCDFSGYSDIAVGVARLFGILLQNNFNLPYFSKSIYDFWKRWHISLTTWFRDYLYIPLGGNRKGRHRTMANAIIVFVVSGLWHGAAYTFLAWGLYHAALYVPASLLRKKKKNNDTPALTTPTRGSSIITSTLSMGFTFLLVMIGRIIYRSDSVPIAWEYVKLMFSHFSTTDIYPVIGKTALW